MIIFYFILFYYLLFIYIIYYILKAITTNTTPWQQILDTEAKSITLTHIYMTAHFSGLVHSLL